MDELDPYAVLEVSPSASAQEIEDAYERLARRYQPDPNKDPTDPDKMRKVNDAFDLLDDADLRAEYDRSRAEAPDRAAPSGSATAAASEGRDRQALFAVGLIALGAGVTAAVVVLSIFVIFDGDGAASGFIRTDSGLQYRQIEAGGNDRPEEGDRVIVDYVGTFENGLEFDSAVGFDFVLGTGEVIAGWDEGIALMHVGDRYQFVIPPELAYGEAGRDRIPPNTTLVFDVLLVSYEPAGGAP